MTDYQGSRGLEILELVIIHGFDCILNMVMASKCSKAMWERGQSRLFVKCVYHEDFSATVQGKKHSCVFNGIAYVPKECVFCVSPYKILHLGYSRYKFAQDFQIKVHDIRNYSFICLSTVNGKALFDVYKRRAKLSWTDTPYELFHAYEKDQHGEFRSNFSVKKRKL
jgi:hypothetical protein